MTQTSSRWSDRIRDLGVRCGVADRLVLPVLLLLCVPLPYALTLKLQRLSAHGASPGLGRSLVLLTSDFAFQLALLCTAALALILCSAAGRLLLGFLLVQLLALGAISIDTIAHGYFLETGRSMELDLFLFGLGQIGELVSIVTAESSAWMNGIAFGLPALLLALSWWSFLRPQRGTARSLPPARPAHALVLLALATLMTALAAAAPQGAGNASALLRPPMLNLALDAWRRIAAPDPGEGADVAPRALGATRLQHRGGAMRNLVVIILESTSAVATTPYTPALGTTPFLAELAERSLVAERVHAVVPHTTKALVGLLCGYEPHLGLDATEAREGALPGRCLPALLAEQGYRTAYFQAPTEHFESRRGLVANLGYDHFVAGDSGPHEGLERVNYFGWEDRVMLAPSREWLERHAGEHAGQPFFTTYLTTGGHSPYKVPSSFTRQSFAEAMVEPGDEQEDRSAAQLRDRADYYNALAYVDTIVREIVEDYARFGLDRNTVFLVVGDHGEAMWEHDLRGHNFVMFDEVLRVPLLLVLPAEDGRRGRLPGTIGQIAVVPTLLDALGFEVADGAYEAASFLDGAQGDAVLSTCFGSRHCAAISRGERKLIYHFGEQRAELYDLAADPYERRDIAGAHPELVAAWTQEVLDWATAIDTSYLSGREQLLAQFVSSSPPAADYTPLRLRLGSYVELLGVRTPMNVKPGREFGVTYYLHVLESMSSGHRLRLRGSADGLETVFDHVPARGLYPLSEWVPGQYITDHHTAVAPSEWSAKSMRLCLELEDASGRPLPIEAEGGESVSCHPIAEVPVGRAIDAQRALRKAARETRPPRAAEAESEADPE